LLRHGYTLTDVGHMTRRAALSSRWTFMRYEDKADLARFAIVEFLLTCEEPPGFWDLVNAGERAISRWVESEGRYRGVYYAGRGNVAAGTPLVRYDMYWRAAASPTQSPENLIVDVTALRQIWPRLTRPHQAVLLALATHGDPVLAAKSLDRPHRSFVSTLSLARQQFLRLWHEHETPSRVWARDRGSLRAAAKGPNYNKLTVSTIRRRERRRQRALEGPQGPLTRAQKIRAWAVANGWKVGKAGQLPTAVVAAYTNANGDEL
jgi:hypothetical protein